MYSNLLYLLSFLPVSKKTAYWLGFSSAAYQVFLNFYQSAVRVQVANKSKTTGYDKNVGYAKAASQALLGLYMAKRAFDFYRIANLVQYFILTRGGHHKTGLDGSLDERGVNQVERMASSIKEQVVDKLGITEATYVASSQKSSGETAEILAKNLEMKMGVTSNGIFLVPETRERIESPVQKLERKERAKHPVDIAFKQLTPYQQWVTPYEPTDPNCESSRDMYVRLKGAIRGFFANCDFNPRRLTVFVTHGTVMQNYLRGLNQRYPSAAADAFIEERYGEGEGALLSRDIDGKVKAVARYEFRKNEQVYPKQQPTPAIDTGTPVNSVAGDTAVPSSSNDVFML
jgi:broad specificity phosphatase PhoE